MAKLPQTLESSVEIMIETFPLQLTNREPLSSTIHPSNSQFRLIILLTLMSTANLKAPKEVLQRLIIK